MEENFLKFAKRYVRRLRLRRLAAPVEVIDKETELINRLLVGDNAIDEVADSDKIRGYLLNEVANMMLTDYLDRAGALGVTCGHCHRQPTCSKATPGEDMDQCDDFIMQIGPSNEAKMLELLNDLDGQYGIDKERDSVRVREAVSAAKSNR